MGVQWTTKGFILHSRSGKSRAKESSLGVSVVVRNDEVNSPQGYSQSRSNLSPVSSGCQGSSVRKTKDAKYMSIAKKCESFSRKLYILPYLQSPVLNGRIQQEDACAVDPSAVQSQIHNSTVLVCGAQASSSQGFGVLLIR